MIEHSRIGIDIGRVILSAADPDGRSDSSFLGSRDQEALETPPTEGAFDIIARIVARSGGNVWLVSKAGPRVQALTLRWLEHWRFYDVTGLHRRHVRFCRERSEKREHAEDLGLTHFVDDRVDVHQHLRGVVRRLYISVGVRRRRHGSRRRPPGPTSRASSRCSPQLSQGRVRRPSGGYTGSFSGSARQPRL